MHVEQKLESLGLVLPPPLVRLGGMRLPYESVRIRGNRALIAGHGPQGADGTLAWTGKVGADVTVEEAYEAARLTGLAMLGSLQRALGNLDRVTAWLRVFGMVNGAPGFTSTPAVINGFSDLILELFGPEIGAHARSAVGLAELPMNMSVEIEAEVEIELAEG